jgi:molybdopterin-guanine dinucleotide biosynthesis protein
VQEPRCWDDRERKGRSPIRPDPVQLAASPAKPSSQPKKIQSKFDEIQANAIKSACGSRESVYLAGWPGCGKTHTTREIVRVLNAKGLAVAYVSFMWATAILAGHGEGCTSLHSLLSSGLLDKSVNHYLRRGSKQFKKLCAQLLPIDVLILEEIQTFPPELLDKIECIFREVKAKIDAGNAFKPWYGIQIVANGDILQSMQRRKSEDGNDVGYNDVDYLFQLPGFEGWFDLAVVLKNFYRAQGDDGYTGFLHEICEGERVAVQQWR